jgi:hypothetical protein
VTTVSPAARRQYRHADGGRMKTVASLLMAALIIASSAVTSNQGLCE